MLAVGWRRTTMTDVARRAGVSRMTVYRRWPDMDGLTADLLAREFAGVGLHQLPEVAKGDVDAARMGAAVAAAAVAVRDNPLFAKIVDVDPELLLPYLLDRRGRTQDGFLASLVAALRAGQRGGGVRRGRPETLARTVLLMTYGFVLSAPTMDDDRYSPRTAFRELAGSVERYLS